MLPYNIKSADSIYNYAKMLEGLSFSEAIKFGSKYLNTSVGVVGEENEAYYTDINAKGSSGQLLEKYYFGYETNSSSEPDFKEASMELKIAPLKVTKDKSLSSKERMVLTIINYQDVVNESFETSHLIRKAYRILMVFYIHDASKNKLDMPIVNVYKYEIPDDDMIIIKRDWEKIRGKIKSGKAHLISEGDTFFLGACTKGATSDTLRSQPFSKELAMQRAFAFKNSYVNYIYKNYVLGESDVSEQIVANKEDLERKAFEDIVLSRIDYYVGMTESKLYDIYGLNIERKPKNIFSMLTFRMLGINTNKAKEFVKANIVVKAIRLDKNGKLKESMSFPAFKFMDLLQQEWYESDLYNTFSETKFLFVVYKMNQNDEYELKGSQFWNMPIDDLEGPVRKVWEETKKIIHEGIIVCKKGERSTNNLPSMSSNPVCHVRPHGRDRFDTYPLPDGSSFTKQCFWLNNSYVLSKLDLKFKSEE